jgi:hypothetical protein
MAHYGPNEAPPLTTTDMTDLNKFLRTDHALYSISKYSLVTTSIKKLVAERNLVEKKCR